MADFKEIPVVEVDKQNFCTLWPSLLLAIKNATFIALDVELSGIGSKNLLFAKSIEDRYREMCDAAKTRSVISLGLSCFKTQSCEQEKTVDNVFKTVGFQVQTFNLMLLCSESYTVDPSSLKFLIEHGFDFNKQYALGISYYRGNDKKDDTGQKSLRQLFTELILSKVPIVLHNALVDLVFMYQSFYATTPSSLQTFLADLTEIFHGGVYDTKYIAEFKARMPASYLEYVFRKCQRDNLQRMKTGPRYVTIQCLQYPTAMGDTIVILPCALDNQPEESQVGKANVCTGYAAHGWCKFGNSCLYSHDIDFILDSEDKAAEKKHSKHPLKRRKLDVNSESEETDLENISEDIDKSTEQDILTVNQEMNKGTDLVLGDNDQSHEKCVSIVRKTGGHRAGFDSFMTGFAFATFILKYGKKSPNILHSSDSTLFDFGLEDFTNKVPLSGKDIPLLIQKSNFAKVSKEHSAKFKKINTK